ncbi:glycosaminoglycan attachment site [[Flexibacter] sp. ATCC 35208]|uniref:glycosaminoglycan attachment site n=1 Tax=[Flexibacter] sp. ATCC 35208 TaxID=1936242 RepID=UPI0009C70140|nr:glycosaminoglycan attachment site [[Flexibacter] sp. ATCC 35208]OMP74564.1 glycosaminoglycan attachment site [[Flexibacter] sp. ATCC 35208]
MEKLPRISRNLFNIYTLFTREPFIHHLAQELEFYSDHNGILGVILIDLIDNDFSAILLSRDSSKQYKAESLQVSFPNIEEARIWLEKEYCSDRVSHHEESKYFDLFKPIVSQEKRHPNFDFLNEHIGFLAAKEVMKEISYHYKDIDGNFIQQFQSLNGFDARLWEIYLYCFCREEYFSFKKGSHAPDLIIEKMGVEIAIEAVTINPTENTREALLNISRPFTQAEVEEKLKNEMPIKYATVLTKKLKKRYWELSHVAGKSIIIAVADFHAYMSMTWSFSALLEYLYGYKISHSKDVNGNVKIDYTPIEGFVKGTGIKVPAGFFSLPDSENISAVLFTAAGTISKFNRMGKQAGLGSMKNSLIRAGMRHDHDPNAVVPIPFHYVVNEECNETWAEGVSIFHNPNALIKIDPKLFPSVAHHFLIDGKILSTFPDFFPYFSMTNNIVTVE